MAKRVTAVASMPNADCPACHGIGAIPMTAHFYTGDQEWEAPCWMCYGNTVAFSLPKPRSTDNA
jgi:DnaJ-class molecular chaperone